MNATKKWSDGMLSNLWRRLRDIPTTDDGVYLDADFYIWTKGTDVHDVWRWFDAKHSVGLYRLMKLG